MKKKYIAGILSMILGFSALAILPASCDFTKPKKKFRLVVPKTEYFYNYMTDHLKPFLERQGYEISIIPCDSVLEAARMVAEGEADLTFVNNHSTTVALKLS